MTDNFYYLNFDDERLVNFELDDFQNFLTISHKSFTSKILLFDEIQNIAGWERFVRRVFDDGYKVIITGSNAKLLSSELATHLTGRYLQIKLYPFSFVEYLQFSGIEITHKTTEQQAEILHYFDKYLQQGGFPEFLKYNDTDYVLQLYEDILYKDLIVRFNIKHQKALRQLALYIVTNFASPVSVSKLSQLLSFKSANTTKDYLDYLQQVYLILECSKYDYSLKKVYSTNPKFYVIDNGLRNFLSLKFSSDNGRLLENTVFLELKRRSMNVFYYVEKNFELDFYIPEQKLAIQVAYDLTETDTMQRELKAFEHFSKKFHIDKAVIITYNTFDELKSNHLKITVLPFWYWAVKNVF